MVSIALIAVATIPESTAHLYQMSLYIDRLAKELGRKPLEIKRLIGLNLVVDGSDDIVVGFLGGCAGTNYGENNSLVAITRNYSVRVLMAAGVMAIRLSIYLFGVIGMQGIALIQSEKVNLFEPRQLAVGATILVTGIGGNLFLPNGLFPFTIPVLFPSGPGDCLLGDRRYPIQPSVSPASAFYLWSERARESELLGGGVPDQLWKTRGGLASRP